MPSSSNKSRGSSNYSARTSAIGSNGRQDKELSRSRIDAWVSKRDANVNFYGGGQPSGRSAQSARVQLDAWDRTFATASRR